ncbi:MAG: ABC transporter substrate-binding protein [Oscillospiraceae bacterium]|jgi:putative ABC transport system substrate-binding protein|nr:ABC transporter substrate-binding protein [Oscillospiraceae bacterium]
MKKTFALILALTMLLVLAACGSTTSAPSGDTESNTPSKAESTEKNYSIAIAQFVEHPALDAARDGFIQALADNGYKNGENVTITVENAAADSSNLTTIADQFISNNVDLILAIATPAAQAIAGKTTTIPILGTAITDYVAAGLVDSNEAPGRNISGTTDMNPISDQIDLLVKLVPNAQTVGFVYTSSEDNSIVQIDIAKAYIESIDLAWKEVTVTSTNDVQQAVTSIVTEVDALYLPTDNIIANTMPTVYGVTAVSKTPVITAEQGMVEQGGLATLGLNYYDLGYQTGLMAIEVLNGADTATLPIRKASNFDYAINGDVAEAIGYTIPDDLQEYVFTAAE